MLFVLDLFIHYWQHFSVYQNKAIVLIIIVLKLPFHLQKQTRNYFYLHFKLNCIDFYEPNFLNHCDLKINLFFNTPLANCQWLSFKRCLSGKLSNWVHYHQMPISAKISWYTPFSFSLSHFFQFTLQSFWKIDSANSNHLLPLLLLLLFLAFVKAYHTAYIG